MTAHWWRCRLPGSGLRASRWPIRVTSVPRTSARTRDVLPERPGRRQPEPGDRLCRLQRRDLLRARTTRYAPWSTDPPAHRRNGDAGSHREPASTFAPSRPVTTATNRWGDYSGLSLARSNQSSFWVYNEYACTQRHADRTDGGVTEDGRWSTKLGQFSHVPAGSGGDCTFDSVRVIVAARSRFAARSAPT